MIFISLASKYSPSSIRALSHKNFNFEVLVWMHLFSHQNMNAAIDQIILQI